MNGGGGVEIARSKLEVLACLETSYLKIIHNQVSATCAGGEWTLISKSSGA